MPADPTTAQSAASRDNGALSQGPVTEAGKAAASRNALKHGLRAGGFEVRPEESEWFAELLADHVKIYAPHGPVEHSVVEAMALSAVKLARLDRLELEALAEAGDAEAEADPRLARLATLTRYASRVIRERTGLERQLSELQERRRQSQPAARAHRAALWAAFRGDGDVEPRPEIAHSNPSEPEAQRGPRPLNRHERRRREKLAGRAA